VLANAIKFSPPGGCIEIVGERADNGELRLVVRDEGPGIPAAELDKVFDAFVQSSQTKDGSGGTGLGLAICRKIIDAHGGSIHAENLPQRGTAFHIVVPSRVGSGGQGQADAGPSGFMPTQ
jgi:signal transduction histidine kinase